MNKDPNKDIFVEQGREMDINLYVSLMNEVKLRTNSIHDILSGAVTTSYPFTNAEFMCLQIRKILELIAMGSIVANKEEFEAYSDKFSNCWNARLILQDIERLNPDFYPKPVVEIREDHGQLKSRIEDKRDGFLTRDEFVKVYEKCGKFMHSYNPYGSKHDLDYYMKNIPIWLNKIIGLLNSHMIKLLGATNFYLIHMQDDRDEFVHGYDFGMLSSKASGKNVSTEITSNSRMIAKEITDANGTIRTKLFKAED